MFLVCLKEIEQLSDKLQVTDVKIVLLPQCKEMYEGIELFDGMMCAGQPDGGKDACQVRNLPACSSVWR